MWDDELMGLIAFGLVMGVVFPFWVAVVVAVLFAILIGI